MSLSYHACVCFMLTGYWLELSRIAFFNKLVFCLIDLVSGKKGIVFKFVHNIKDILILCLCICGKFSVLCTSNTESINIGLYVIDY